MPSIWFGFDICGIALVFKDAVGNRVPSNAIKICRASCRVEASGSQPITLELTVAAQEGDRGFLINPFRFESGWNLAGERNLPVSFCVELKHRGDRCCLNGTMSATFMSGPPRRIELQGGSFDKVLARDQQITCKLKVADAWGNPFRGIENRVDATAAVVSKDWLRGNAANGALVPLQNVTSGIVSVGQRDLCVILDGKFGMKDSITFTCHAIDHRKNPPAMSELISLSQPFEVEDLELQFCIPSSISNKFKTFIQDGWHVIELNRGICDVQRKALHGINLQLIKKGTTKIHATHSRDSRISIQRSRIDDGLVDDSDDTGEMGVGDNVEEFHLDLKEGKTAMLDKHLSIVTSSCFVANFSGLETKMKILVIPGKPGKLTFEKVEAAEVGSTANVQFKVVDDVGLVVQDLSQYVFEIEAEEAPEGMSIQTSEVESAGGGHRFGCTVLGTLPESSRSQLSVWMSVRLVMKADGADDSRAEESEVRPIRERVEVVVRPGPAKKLRLASRNGGVCLPLTDRLKVVTGTKTEFIVQAVDAHGNIDPTVGKRRVLITAQSCSASDEICRAEGTLSQGEAVVSLGPWYARGVSGTLVVALKDSKLESSTYSLEVLAGSWPAEIRVVSPSQAAESGLVTLDDTAEALDGLQVEVVSANGSVNSHSRLEVQLKHADGPPFVPDFDGGKYTFNRIPVPAQEGEYILELFVKKTAELASGAVPNLELRVVRTTGSLSMCAVSLSLSLRQQLRSSPFGRISRVDCHPLAQRRGYPGRHRGGGATGGDERPRAPPSPGCGVLPARRGPVRGYGRLCAGERAPSIRRAAVDLLRRSAGTRRGLPPFRRGGSLWGRDDAARRPDASVRVGSAALRAQGQAPAPVRRAAA